MPRRFAKIVLSLDLTIGISWSIKETASSGGGSTFEGKDSGLQKSSSSYAAFPKQASSYSLSSFFKGRTSPYGKLGRQVPFGAQKVFLLSEVHDFCAVRSLDSSICKSNSG